MQGTAPFAAAAGALTSQVATRALRPTPAGLLQRVGSGRSPLGASHRGHLWCRLSRAWLLRCLAQVCAAGNASTQMVSGLVSGRVPVGARVPVGERAPVGERVPVGGRVLVGERVLVVGGRVTVGVLVIVFVTIR